MKDKYIIGALIVTIIVGVLNIYWFLSREKGQMNVKEEAAATALAQPDSIVPEKHSTHQEVPAPRIEKKVVLEELDPTLWTAVSYPMPVSPAVAFDGNSETRWTTAEFQEPGQSFTLDIKTEAYVGKIVMDSEKNPEDLPVSFVITGSTDSENWFSLASGESDYGVIEIVFPQKKVRYIRIDQTGTSIDRWWSIHELKVFGEQL